MNRLVPTLLIACLGALSAPSASSAQAPAAAVSDSVNAHRAVLGFLTAFDSLRWEPFRAYLADDVTVFFPFASVAARADGRASVERVFGAFFEQARAARVRAGAPVVLGLDPHDLRVQLVGRDVALITFHLGSGTPSRRSFVFRRAPGGEWKLLHLHASPAPAQAATDPASVDKGTPSPPAASPPSAAPPAPAGSSATVDPTGFFEFTSRADGQSFQGTIRITRSAAGVYSGSVATPLTGSMSIRSVRVRGNRVQISALAAQGEAQITLDIRGDQITGTWSYAQMTGALRGRRS